MAKRHKRGFGQISKLPSGRFRARYTGPDLALHNGPTTYTHKEHAEAWLADESRLISSGNWTPPRQRKAALVAQAARDAQPVETVSQYCERVIERRTRRAKKPLRRTTADLYRKDLRLRVEEPLGALPLVELTRDKVAAWWDSLPTSTPTQNGRAYDTLKSIMSTAVKDGLVAANPCDVEGAGKPEPKNSGVALTASEVLAYLAAVPEPRRVALMAAAWCGLRSGEVRGLRRGDVDLENGVLRVEQGVTRVKVAEGQWENVIGPLKTRAARRTVAMPQVMTSAMRTYLASLSVRGREALIFTAGDGVNPLHGSTLDRAHDKARRAIGRPELRIHDLRRTAATLAAQGGATTKELMAMLGHTTVTMAMVYQTADDARDAERAARLDAVIAAAG